MPQQPLDDVWNYLPQGGELRGRNVLISGAAGALGSELALACARYGAGVILLGRDVSRLEALYDRIEALDAAPPAIVELDLQTATPAQYAAAQEALAGEYPHLDGLVHAAATLGQLSPVEHISISEWQKAIVVNLQAPLLLTQVCLPLLRRAADASIVFTLDDKVRAYWSGYGVAKAGLHALARVLADEWDPPAGETRNVRVNAVDPGPLRSALRRSAYPAENARRLPEAHTRLGPFLYLLGSASAGINGQLYAGEAAPRPL